MTALLFSGQGCFFRAESFCPGVSMTDCQQYPLPFLCGTKKDSFIFYRIRLFLSVLDHL